MSALLEVIVPLIALGAGVVGERVTMYTRRWLDRRRYKSAVAALESQAEHAPRPAVPVLVTPRVPENFGAEFGLTPPYCFITNLSVRNLRCFSEASVQFRCPDEGLDIKYPNVNLLLGDNGSGKSTILRAVAMAALGPLLNSSGFSSFKLITQGTSEAQVGASFVFGGSQGPVALTAGVSVTRRSDIEVIDAHFADGPWSDLFKESTPSFFVVGYGTNRRVPADPLRTDPAQERGRFGRRYQRVVSLFNDSVPLVPLSSWLPQASSRRQEEVERILRELLPQRAYFTGKFEGGEPVFWRHGVNVPLRAMSDGFRSYISWLGDLLFQLDAVSSKDERLEEIGGIALVDEVDLLLHPSWQRVVVPTISRQLPKVQFIFTTHSPIVAATIESANVIVAREGEEGRSVLDRIDAEIHGLSSEQVLLSSYFGLETTRAPDAMPALDELARRAVDGGDDDARDYLRAIIASERPTPRGQQP